MSAEQSAEKHRLTPVEAGMVQSGRMDGSPVGVVAVVEHIVRERMAQAWDEATFMAIGWPAEMGHLLVNPYRVTPPGRTP